MMALMNCASSSFSSSSTSSPTSSSSSSSYSPREKNMVLQSVVDHDVSSPSFSSDSKLILPIEKTLITHKNSNLCLISKSSEELKKEIASIELEILHMERYLLSLYRKSFEQQISSFYNLSSTTLPRSLTTSPSSLALSNHYQAYQKPISYPRSFHTSLKALSSREGTKEVSGNKSLGELLGSSHIVDDPNFINPNKLSEDIMRCISSVYCTLSRSSTTRRNSACFSASPLSSVSNSSTIFSSKSNHDDKWSLHCASEDHLMNHSQDQGSVLPCGAVVVEALRVYLDDGSFGYAARLLQNFRSLVQNLEKVDPSRMKREEKLAFWINIHNALVMHLLQTLFSPSRKSKTCSVRHVYALEYPEALAHFAISSGAFTDPTVRVYTADRIFRDLRQAKKEFIRSNVRVHKGTKLLLPKVFQHYVKDMSMDVSKLMEATAECLPEDARRIAEKCLKEKKSKNFEWLPENLSFRLKLFYPLALHSISNQRKTTVNMEQLEKSVEENPDDPSLQFELGLYLWDNGGDSEKAAEHFVLSAKLNPNNAAAFKYLGHYYSRVTLDHNRAAKCYQRAVLLDPNDSDSGEALCDLFDRQGKEILEIAVCRDASEKSPKAFWAFCRLGYIQLHQKKWSEAVQSLQHAIRGYPTMSDLWEALGLAYQRLGMFTAAIKAYGRAIELDENKIFALVESANIFLMLGSYRKGVELFEQALKISPQNVSVLYGLASGLLSWSKECINLGAFGWAASLLEDARKAAKANSELASNMSCIWKLHGDIQLTYARCFPWSGEIGNSEFTLKTFNDSILSWRSICYSAALKLPEKMALGALLLESDNSEFWVTLGCMSDNSALKLHALIRALHLDVSLAVAWAFMGQVFRESDEMKLAKLAFDSARSIDPTLALPWAGSADTYARESTSDEAFESCLRAAQISPLAEFQVGLAWLALLQGDISSPQIFACIEQAVQRSPDNPESHNLHGLVCEARRSYHTAIASYKLALAAMSVCPDNSVKSHAGKISINLVRSLSKAGRFKESVMECANLKSKGLLDAGGLQIYAFSLWKIGDNDSALSVIRDLAGRISTMEKASIAFPISFICSLLYCISGLDSAITSIQKMPKDFFQSSRISFIVSAIHSLDQSDRLQSIVASTRSFITSQEEIAAMHYLIALSKLLKTGEGDLLGFEKGIAHLRKALHMYPHSNLLRNLLGYILLAGEGTKDASTASRCCIINVSEYGNKEGLKSALEVLGGGSVACNAIGNAAPRFSFPTCHCQCLNAPVVVVELQRFLHQEPWNSDVRYLLILNLVQKAREQRFPRQLCSAIERLISVALSDETCSKEGEYQKFQLLLCASEISLQKGNVAESIDHARKASSISLPCSYLFLGHLQLCRAYAAKGSTRNVQEEYRACLELKTDSNIGWICLKLIETQFDLEPDTNLLEMSIQESSRQKKDSWKEWMAVYSSALGLVSIGKKDFFSAEEFIAQACSLGNSESCLLLCHGAVCMELARQFNDSQFLSQAVKSLSKVQASALFPLPIVYTLLAQAHGSLGSKEKWEKNLRLEWFCWPPEMRPAEVYFQMHILARQSENRPETASGIENCQTPEKWVLRAIHTNPSCMRYWNVLPKLVEIPIC
ncbi:unnamed protein product [Thlaspi arvense]|uniref:DUF547 domain-containing protein n=1 Tax=Thlaspi arvense TaxID=13288 RepID=A0AAU9SJC7_THLAR|nr:unnamed protein product [Thlaspi arvense]